MDVRCFVRTAPGPSEDGGFPVHRVHIGSDAAPLPRPLASVSVAVKEGTRDAGATGTLGPSLRETPATFRLALLWILDQEEGSAGLTAQPSFVASSRGAKMVARSS